MLAEFYLNALVAWESFKQITKMRAIERLSVLHTLHRSEEEKEKKCNAR